MKRIRAVVVVFLALAISATFFSSNVFAVDTVKLKQKIGKDYTIYWQHTPKFYVTEITYSSKSKLTVGMGPNLLFKIGRVDLKVYGYQALVFDVSKNNWPMGYFESDDFVILSTKKWQLSARTDVDLDRNSRALNVYWGENFIGYWISKCMMLEARTEWSHPKGVLTQSFGPGFAYKASNTLTVSGYFGVITSTKGGWIEIKHSI